MKNLAALIISLSCFLSGQAQVSDTLGWSTFEMGTETIYESPNGGYAFGNNGYGDKVKAQTFSSDAPFVLKEAWLKFGSVQFGSSDSTSAVWVNVYLNNGPGITLTSNSDTLAPDSVVYSTRLFVHELEEGGITRVDLTSETIVIGAFQQFSIGVSFDSLAVGDTICLISTTDGDAGGTQNAWELTAQDNWIVVSQPAYSWNLDVDLGIFALIDRNDPADVEEQYGSTILNVYPNPTNGVLNVSSNDFINSSEPFYVLITDQLGKLVYSATVQKGNFWQVDVNGLKPGTYFISVSNDERFAVSRFIKL